MLRLAFLVVYFAASFSLTVCANPSVIGIEPFVGEFSEGFETFAPGEIPGAEPNLAGPVPLLNGHAVLSGINARYDVNPFYVWDSYGGFSLDDLTEAEGHVSAVPFDGRRIKLANSSLGKPNC